MNLRQVSLDNPSFARKRKPFVHQREVGFRLETGHCLTGLELSKTELGRLLDLADALRLERTIGVRRNVLEGKTIALLFEKPSLRTRVSFTVAIEELGGHAIVLESSGKKSEEPEDTIRVLAGYCHGVMVRTHEHSILERMVEKSTIPIINGLSDSHHPCQVFADLLTLKQTFGDLRGKKLAYVGDGNNMLHSLLLLAPLLGVEVHFACPKGFEPEGAVVAKALANAQIGGGRVVAHPNARSAVSGADAVYTDVWTSMGFEGEEARREEAFADYALTEELYSYAKKGALIMHCMPMIRDKEIASSLVEHECSALFRQSENRLHAQKALLIGLMGK